MRERSRVDALRRALLGKRLAPRVASRVAAGLQRSARDIEFVSLEESDAIYAALELRWAEAKAAAGSDLRYRRLLTSDRREVERFAATLRGQLRSVPMYLFQPESDYCGAVVADSCELLQHVTTLTTLDQNDVVACTQHASIGIVCEYFTDWREGASRATYRFVSWNAAPCTGATAEHTSTCKE